MVAAYMFTYFFVFLLLLRTGTEFYLSWRNSRYVKNHHEVPPRFAATISLADHQKAQAYTIDKGKLSRSHHLFSAILLYVWVMGGGLEWLDQFWRLRIENELWRGLTLLMTFSFLSSVIELPWSVYETFVLEEKYGFNKTTPKTFVMDLIKQALLGMILGVPLLLALLWVMKSLGGHWWWVGWALLIAFQFLMVWAWPRFLAPLFNKFTPLPEGELKDRVHALLARCDFRSSGLFVMNASLRSAHGNAYFTGLGKNKRIVFFDTLINTLTPAEVEAVLAHELGHFKLKHIVKKMAVSVLASFAGFALLGRLVQMPEFFHGHQVSTPSAAMALLLFSLVGPLYLFFFVPLSSYFSRKHEFEADHFAKKYSSASDLANALVKMYRDNASSLTPDPLFSAFYYSHPPALERLTELERSD